MFKKSGEFFYIGEPFRYVRERLVNRRYRKSAEFLVKNDFAADLFLQRQRTFPWRFDLYYISVLGPNDTFAL
jgi:hypothetical protein